MDLDTQRRDDTIASIKDDAHVDAFLAEVASFTPQQLKLIVDERKRFAREASEATRERWFNVQDSEAALSASVHQHLRRRLADLLEHDIDHDWLRTTVNYPANAIKESALFALRALLNRHKLTDEEYRWFIGPYLAAGFPREIFYPEEA